jgi:anti-anti-sigma regulatory factor
VAPALREAVEKLDGGGGEVVMDFSLVRRVDAGVLNVMEKLANAAEGKSVKVLLCGVNPGVYKALKLAALAPRFSFVN